MPDVAYKMLYKVCCTNKICEHLERRDLPVTVMFLHRWAAVRSPKHHRINLSLTFVNFMQMVPINLVTARRKPIDSNLPITWFVPASAPCTRVGPVRVHIGLTAVGPSPEQPLL